MLVSVGVKTPLKDLLYVAFKRVAESTHPEKAGFFNRATGDYCAVGGCISAVAGTPDIVPVIYTTLSEPNSPINDMIQVLFFSIPRTTRDELIKNKGRWTWETNRRRVVYEYNDMLDRNGILEWIAVAMTRCGNAE